MKIVCAHCRKTADKPAGAIKRARDAGLRVFCGRRCAGLARRKHKTKAQLVEEKRLYDAEYRKKNRALLKAKKAEYFQRTYDPAKARVERKKNMARHVEYCRRPEYRVWKKGYDRRYRSNRLYGPFADAAMLAVDLKREIMSRSTDYEIRKANGTLNKTQARRRETNAEGERRNRHRAVEGFSLA